MTAATPGQAARAACEAFWRVIRGRDGLRNDPADAWPWAQFQGAEEAWQAAVDAAIAAQEPRPAPGETGQLWLKHTVTSNRLGHALAALREIAEPRGDEFPRDTARNALDDDAAIRDNIELTREPQPAPDLGTAWRLLDEARAGLRELTESVTALAAEWVADAEHDETRVRPTVISDARARTLRECADELRKRTGLPA